MVKLKGYVSFTQDAFDHVVLGHFLDGVQDLLFNLSNLLQKYYLEN